MSTVYVITVCAQFLKGRGKSVNVKRVFRIVIVLIDGATDHVKEATQFKEFNIVSCAAEDERRWQCQGICPTFLYQNDRFANVTGH